MMKLDPATAAATTLLLLVVASALVAETSASCDKSEFLRCLRNIRGDLYSDLTRPRHIYSQASQHNDTCSGLEDLRQCVANTSCEEYQDGTAKRYVAFLEFICSDDNRRVYQDNIACIVDGTTRYNVTSCVPLFNNGTGCESMQKYFECMEKMIEMNCGQSAVDVYVGALKKVYRDPCHDSPGGSTGQHMAPVWILSSVLWTLLTLWLTSL